VTSDSPYAGDRPMTQVHQLNIQTILLLYRPTDVIKEIKQCNVFKELKGHSGGLKEINGQLVAPVKSLWYWLFFIYFL
jgi:hypothetical protein